MVKSGCNQVTWHLFTIVAYFSVIALINKLHIMSVSITQYGKGYPLEGKHYPFENTSAH